MEGSAVDVEALTLKADGRATTDGRRADGVRLYGLDGLRLEAVAC
jgi:hypothetical protein